jgi:ABC-2 type transport system permease protein
MTASLRKVLLRLWSSSLRAEMEYRSNFIFAALQAVFATAATLFTVRLFYADAGGFAAWSEADALLVVALSSLCHGFVASVLAPNLSRIVEHVEKGTLDFVLLKPVDAQLLVSLRALSLWGLPDVGIGASVLAYALSMRASAWSVIDVVCGVVTVFSGLALLYALWFLLACTSIWFTKIYNAVEVLRGLLDAARYPMSAYPAGYRVFFTYIVPIAFLTTVPAETFAGRGSPAITAVSVGVAVLAFALCRAAWKRALRSYTGASG